MKSQSKKLGTQANEQQTVPDLDTQLDDEIDELLDDAQDQTTTIANAQDTEENGEETTTALLQRIAQLESQLSEAENARMRALADYQNLQRRSQADRASWVKLANQELVVLLIEPLEHLRLAAEQIKDKGLSMVVEHLFERLEQQGLKKIEALHKPFDEHTMEAVEGSQPNGKKVVRIVSNGYTLNGVLIQPAKVTVE